MKSERGRGRGHGCAGGSSRGRQSKRAPKSKVEVEYQKFDVLELSDNDDKLLRNRNLRHGDTYEYDLDTIDPEDDEEIDSDEAMGLGSDMSDDDGGSDVYFNDQELTTGSKSAGKQQRGGKMGWLDDVTDKTLLDSASDDASPLSSDGESDTGMQSMVKALSSSKRQDKDKTTPTGLDEQTEIYAESEFNVPGAAADKVEVSLENLMSAFSSESGFNHVQDHLRGLQDNPVELASKPLDRPLPSRLAKAVKHKEAYRRAVSDMADWAALAKRRDQDDHVVFTDPDRPRMGSEQNIATAVKVGDAYLRLGKEQNGWSQTGYENMPKRPKTDMETQVHAVLKANNLTSAAVRKSDKLPVIKLTMEQLAEQRVNAQMMRELMVRQELYQKRAKKIKSKTFRRILRLEKKRQGVTDASLADEMSQEDQLKLEADRARERLTLRHKNTGKWAKGLLRTHQRDPNARQALMDQLIRHEELVRRINDQPLGCRNGDADEDPELQEIMQQWRSEGTTKEQAVAKLDQLADLQQRETTAPTKGVFAMKFMQNALKRDYDQAELALQEIRDEIDALDSDEDDDSQRRGAASKRRQTNTSASATGNPGRRTFTGPIANARSKSSKSSVQMPVHVEPTAGDAMVDTLMHDASMPANTIATFTPPVIPTAAHSVRLSGPMSVNMPTKPSAPNTAEPAPENNPWLDDAAESEAEPIDVLSTLQKVPKADTTIAVSNCNAPAQAPTSPTNTSTTRRAPIVAKHPWNEIDVVGPSKRVASESEASSSELDSEASSSGSGSDSSDSDSGDDGENAASSSPKSTAIEASATSLSLVGEDDEDAEDPISKYMPQPLAHLPQFKNDELARLAFADDQVVDDFAEEKRIAEQKEAAPKASNFLPGWGSWSGQGAKPMAKKPRVDSKSKPTDGKAKTKSHLILYKQSLQMDPKYTTQTVPFPYTSIEEYQQSMQLPLGRDWNTYSVHSKLVKPKAITQMGTIIDPMKAPRRK
ncbi:hypothetical protein H4R34_003857 [Dimargaris verticillata]|uniref:Small-subunit processome n=1 Tax=Dimargaris verticillata TaxID=2761393 RepID=A0A9W8AZY1_9FUNG|nr:hypothetical protein H4R34_003857 [Dimargaris verticillata]